MKLIITRHGETIENSKMICQGQTDGHLSDLGFEQAKKLALRLKNEKIDIAFSSDLLRAKVTAEEILKFHKKVKLVLDKRIRERCWGELEGKKFPSDFTPDIIVKGQESTKEMFARANEFISELERKYPKKNILIVCHGGIKRVILAILSDETPKNATDRHIKNTSLSIVEIIDGKKKFHLLNCTKHLDD